MYRQGDVLLIRVNHIPLGALPEDRADGRIILAYGEATGHAHAIAEADAEVFSHEGRRFVRIGLGGATLAHEEHGAIPLPAGEYRVVTQREYSPDENRNVAD